MDSTIAGLTDGYARTFMVAAAVMIIAALVSLGGPAPNHNRVEEIAAEDKDLKVQIAEPMAGLGL